MFRPAGIQPLHGSQVQNRLGSGDLCCDRTAAVLAGPRRSPKFMTTTEQVGRAMIKVTREMDIRGPILESADINADLSRHSGAARRFRSRNLEILRCVKLGFAPKWR